MTTCSVHSDCELAACIGVANKIARLREERDAVLLMAAKHVEAAHKLSEENERLKAWEREAHPVMSGGVVDWKEAYRVRLAEWTQDKEVLESRLAQAQGLLENAATMYKQGGFVGDNVDRWFNNMFFILRALEEPK